jgi:pimeloyl-ACP methyl ester carboxylesterase
VWHGRIDFLGGRAVHHIDAGAGRPVILLHGLGGLAQEILDGVGRGRVDGRLIAVDRPGYGLTDRIASAGPSAQARWLHAALPLLAGEKIILVAHSIGAATALCFALDHPDDVAGLLLIAPYCRPTRPAFAPLLRAAGLPLLGPFLRRSTIPRLANRFGPRRLARVFWPNPVPAYLKSFPFRHAASESAILAMSGELRAFNRSMIPAALRLRRLNVPTVIVAGTSDPVAAFPRHAAWLAHRIPDSRLVRLEGVGHMPHHAASEDVRAELNRLVHRA